MEDDDEQFCSMVAYFWKEKEDPTRYVGWDRERCERVMNTFYTAWTKFEAAKRMLYLLADTYDPYGSRK